MKVGDLVKWSLSWVVMRREDAFWDNVDYRKQIGVLEREWALGWYVTWSDGETKRVHRDYLEAL
jgi:hypothetical protein